MPASRPLRSLASILPLPMRPVAMPAQTAVQDAVQGAGQRAGRRSIFIVGSSPVARNVRDYFEQLPQYRFRGFVSDEISFSSAPAQQDDVLGSIGQSISLARSMFVEELIFAEKPTPQTLAIVLDQAEQNEIDLRYVPNVSEMLGRANDVEYLGDLPTIVLYRKPDRAVQLMLKRALDLLATACLLPLFSPLFAAIALAVKLNSRGPVFYSSERVGLKGRTFTCYKFRTMVPNAEALRSNLLHLNERKDILFKISNDPRVTSIGRFLRKYSFDELPQLWNVLRGDMSLVGPRPCLPSEAAQYKTPHFRRLDVVPGLTGLWQVEARHDPSFDNYIQYDTEYVSRWSLPLDLKILLRTLRVVVLGTGV